MVIEIVKVAKNYGNLQALTDVNMEVKQGEIFGFLGPNGAGKTTTIRIATGFIKPDTGWVRLIGLNPWTQSAELKGRIGFLPDRVAFDSGIDGNGFLKYMSNLHGLKGDNPWQRELLERLELSKSALSRKVKGYSSGMAKKLGLVQALQHRPELLIMDEPTEALDPLVRQTLFQILRELSREGVTIFLSSHVLPDIEEVCEKVALIRKGEIVKAGSVEALRLGKFRTMIVDFVTPPQAGFEIEGAEIVAQEGPRITLRLSNDINQVIGALSRYKIKDIIYEKLSLEELFLEYYGDSSVSDD
ncbi:MAG: ABC transporter [Chloroflexi bacterium]|nr:ABC transporter [Chloroflexota bacterium]|tara:strand:- start:1059 stop:1961 length:903 start_codon:yes stop_codon:yes gene_type:complete